MNQIIRAELYKSKRVSIIWTILILVSALFVSAPFISGARSAGAYDTEMIESLGIITIFLPMLTAYIAGRSYYHRTAMYEVMAGNSHFRILVSKCIAIGIPVALFMFASNLIGIGIAAGMDSAGLESAVHHAFLSFPLILRASLFGVMVTMCLRSVGGIAIVYGRSMIEAIIFIIYSATTKNNAVFDEAQAAAEKGNVLINHLLTQQPSLLTQKTSASIILQLVIGLLVEVLFWGVVYFYVNKKRDF